MISSTHNPSSPRLLLPSIVLIPHTHRSGTSLNEDDVSSPQSIIMFSLKDRFWTTRRRWCMMRWFGDDLEAGVSMEKASMSRTDSPFIWMLNSTTPSSTVCRLAGDEVAPINGTVQARTRWFRDNRIESWCGFDGFEVALVQSATGRLSWWATRLIRPFQLDLNERMSGVTLPFRNRSPISSVRICHRDHVTPSHFAALSIADGWISVSKVLLPLSAMNHFSSWLIFPRIQMLLSWGRLFSTRNPTHTSWSQRLDVVPKPKIYHPKLSRETDSIALRALRILRIFSMQVIWKSFWTGFMSVSTEMLDSMNDSLVANLILSVKYRERQRQENIRNQGWSSLSGPIFS